MRSDPNFEKDERMRGPQPGKEKPRIEKEPFDDEDAKTRARGRGERNPDVHGAMAVKSDAAAPQAGLKQPKGR